MEVYANSHLNWSKKINSDSRTINLLGIYYHLNIQRDFTPGITSMTDRIHYYALLSWYWQNIHGDVNSIDFEKIFVLSCLTHHGGDDKSPYLSNVFNKQKLKPVWDDNDEFLLDKVSINGYASNYYKRQLEIFRCVWRDEFGLDNFSLINKKLSESLGTFPLSFFKKNSFNKDELYEMGAEGLCVCNIENNNEEKTIMSKLLFGFFSNIDGEWDIDEKEFESFNNGKINLKFSGNKEFNNEQEQIAEQNHRRQNTLFLFLKIIKEVNPLLKPGILFRRYIWDALYFSQNREDNRSIEYGRLQQIKSYWEFFQINLYYVYVIEKIFDVIQRIIRLNPGIKRTDILKKIDKNQLFSVLNDKLESNAINKESKLSDILNIVHMTNGSSFTSLNSKINESLLIDNLYDAESNEEIVSHAIVFLLLLFDKFNSIDDIIKEKNRQTVINSIEFLYMDSIFEFIQNNLSKITIEQLIEKLAIIIINRHLHETSTRLSIGTKNWVFLEEDGRLYYERTNLVTFGPQDNRWDSIKNLLLDLDFIYINKNRLNITNKGIEWLKRIE